MHHSSQHLDGQGVFFKKNEIIEKVRYVNMQQLGDWTPIYAVHYVTL
jgi:hypothetical protein